MSAEPDVALKTTIRLTDLTRLVGERKQVELQLLRLEQALSALATDAQLNGTLKPERRVTDDAQESMAAVEVMIGALKQRRAKLSSDIEAARHKRHDAATEQQEQREARLLAESQQAMQEHVAQSKRARDAFHKRIAGKNAEHEHKVASIRVNHKIHMSRTIAELHHSISERDKADAEKRKQREVDKALRYREYCQRERERANRLGELEALRAEHHTAMAVKEERRAKRFSESKEGGAHGGRRSNASSPALPDLAHSQYDTSIVGGAGLSAVRELSRANHSRSVTPSLLTPPPRGPELSSKLDASSAAQGVRYKRQQESIVAKMATIRVEEEGRRAVHKEQQYRKAVKKLAEGDAKREALGERLAAMRREQDAHIEESRVMRGQRSDEAMRLSKQRHADFRWSRRAQRLIDTVCSEVLPQEGGAEGGSK